MKIFCIYIVAASLAVLSSRLFALDASVGLVMGAEHSDNALSSEVDQRSELETRAGAEIQVTHEGSSVVAGVDYRAEHVAYDKDTQDDETTVTGDATVTYEQIQNQLFWTIENSRRSVIRDRQLVDLQSNREDRSISSISSRLVLRPSPVNLLSISASYTDIAYEDTNQQDSDRAGAGINWAYNLSKVDQLFADISYQDVTFDTDAADYEYYLAALGYQVDLSHLSYSVAVGYNESKREADSSNGGYFNASATYNRQPSSWQVSILHELTDTSQQNNNDDLTGLDESSNLGAEVDVFERSSMQLTYNNESVCNACTFSASLLYEKEDYETLDNDGEQASVNLGLTYRYSRLLSMGAGAQYSDFSFSGNNTRGDYDQVRYDLNISRSITRSFDVSFVTSYIERVSDDGLTDYDELSGGIRLQYTFD